MSAKPVTIHEITITVFTALVAVTNTKFRDMHSVNPCS